MKIVAIEIIAEAVPIISGVVILASMNQKPYPIIVKTTVSTISHAAPFPASILLIC